MPCCLQKKHQGGPPDFSKEQAYFKEVDAFDLMEESPSPKNFASWYKGREENIIIHDLPAILERWKISSLARRASSEPLFDIMETPILPSVLSNNSTSNRGSGTYTTGMEIDDISLKSTAKDSLITSFGKVQIKEEPVEDSIPLKGEALGPLTSFEQLLMVCSQSAPVTLAEVFSAYW